MMYMHEHEVIVRRRYLVLQSTFFVHTIMESPFGYFLQCVNEGLSSWEEVDSYLFKAFLFLSKAAVLRYGDIVRLGSFLFLPQTVEWEDVGIPVVWLQRNMFFLLVTSCHTLLTSLLLQNFMDYSVSSSFIL